MTTEHDELTTAAERVLKYLYERDVLGDAGDHEDGIMAALPDLSHRQIAAAVEELASRGLIEGFTEEDGEP